MSDISLVLCFASMLFVPCIVASLTLVKKEGQGEAGLNPVPEVRGAALTREELVAKRYRELYLRGLL